MGRKKGTDRETWWVGSKGYIEGRVWRNGKVRYLKLARWLMEQHLGRILDKKEIVHHINGDKLDNRIENLEIKTNGQHTGDHNKKRVYCNTKYTITDKERQRRSEWIRKVHQIRHQRALEKARKKYAQRRRDGIQLSIRPATAR